MKICEVASPRTRIFRALLSVNVGWSHEPLGREGVSHFLEHAVFLGNRDHPNPDLDTGKYGVILNGETMPRELYSFSTHFPKTQRRVWEFFYLWFSIHPFPKIRSEKKKKAK